MSTVWFANLPVNCGEEDFKKFAGAAGAIASVEFGRANRMAWVTYGSPKAAEKAVKDLNTKDFGGRPVKTEITIRGTPEQEKRAEEREAKKAERRAERKPAAASRSSESAPSKFLRVAVGGFPAGTTAEEVSAHLASAGRITSSKATKDGSLVIVTFEEESAAEKALKLNGSNYKSSKLSVEKAQRQPRAAGAEGGARAGRKRTSDEEGEAPKPKVDLATVVWVGNLTAGITAEDVRSMFSLYGPVAEGARAVVVTQVKGKPARPAKEDKPELPATQDGAYAYVTFTEAGSANKAVSGANGKNGLKVELASRAPRKGGQRRRYGGPRKPRA